MMGTQWELIISALRFFFFYKHVSALGLEQKQSDKNSNRRRKIRWV